MKVPHPDRYDLSGPTTTHTADNQTVRVKQGPWRQAFFIQAPAPSITACQVLCGALSRA